MQKGILLSIAFIFALALTACAGAAPASNSNSNQGDGAARPLSLPAKLLVGTLKLENTTNAVNAQQAEALLPLWQLYKSLEASGTTATQETDSVAQQIQAAMTADQVKAIDALNLTGRDTFAVMQQLGLEQNFQGGAHSGTPEARPQGGGENGGPGFGNEGAGHAGGGDGFNPGGDGGGQGFGGGQNLNPQQLATAQARRVQGGFNSNRVPTVLLDALIKLLESKGAPTTTATPTSAPTATEAITSTPAPSAETPVVTPTP